MSNTERAPAETVCDGADQPARIQVLAPREVPLGGPRALTVRRTLPHKERSFVGAWCFVDHYGPDDVSQTGGMDVPPHPHTGLQTVSWLFAGEIEHRDTGGVHALVRPGEVNLMTAGNGIAHSEVSTLATTTLHGVQLWVVLPERDREIVRGFQHHAAETVPLAPGVAGRVFIGSLAGVTSPVATRTPLLGAELHLDAGTSWPVPVDPAHEHGLLVDRGAVSLNGHALAPGDLGIVPAGESVTIEAEDDSLALLLGGEPFDEQIVMWWNFIGRDHDEIVRARTAWQDESDRFGAVDGYDGRLARLPAPELPTGRLRSRTRFGKESGKESEVE